MCKDSATAIINKKQNVAEAVNERWINTFGGYVFDSNTDFMVRFLRTDFVSMPVVYRTPESGRQTSIPTFERFFL